MSGGRLFRSIALFAALLPLSLARPAPAACTLSVAVSNSTVHTLTNPTSSTVTAVLNSSCAPFVGVAIDFSMTDPAGSSGGPGPIFSTLSPATAVTGPTGAASAVFQAGLLGPTGTYDINAFAPSYGLSASTTISVVAP